MKNNLVFEKTTRLLMQLITQLNMWTESSEKLELLKDPILLVITGKPQTLDFGAQYHRNAQSDFDPFLFTCLSSAALSHMRKLKN